MKFYFTGVQKLKDGTEIAIPVVMYESTNNYVARYHQEMAAAALNTDIVSLVVLVFDGDGVIVMNERWQRQYDPSEYPIETEATE